MEDAFVLDLLRDFNGEVLEIHLDEDDLRADDSLQVRASGGHRWRQRPLQQLGATALSSERFESWAHLALTSDELDAVVRVLSSDDAGESEQTGSLLDVSLVDIAFDYDDNDHAPASQASAASVDECYDAPQEFKRLDSTPVQLTTLLQSTPMSWNSTGAWRSAADDERTVWCSPGDRDCNSSRCQYAQCPHAALVLDWCLAHADVLLSSNKQREQAQEQQQQQKQQKDVGLQKAEPTKKRSRRRRAIFSTTKKKKQQQPQRKTIKTTTPSAKPPRQPRVQQPQQLTDASAGSLQCASTRSRRNRRITFDGEAEMEIAL